MKVDRSKLRKSQTEVAPECRQLIQQLKESNTSELVIILRDINTWYYGKCELQHWLDVMDRFDGILAAVAKPVNGSSWILTYDKLDHLEGPEIAAEKRELVNQVLKFTALMLEHSYTRQLYNSVEHLVSLLGASDMEVVLSVLGVLYVFSKRSSFIPRLPAEKRKAIQQRLMFLGETWGGKNAGFGLNFCCKDLPVQDFPPSAGDVYFEFYSQSETSGQDVSTGNQTCTIHIEKLYQFSEEPGEVMEHLISSYVVPQDKQVSLFNKVRLAKHFPDHKRRLKCIQARLQAVSILLYSNASQDVVTHLLYPGFIEEVVSLLEMQDAGMMDIKTAAIRTLTAIVHMEFSPRVNTIIESTGLASYHGFLPTLTRKCIQAMTEPQMEPFPLTFATGLFSFLYHLAYYEVGAEALVSCGLMESLLQVVEFPGGNEHLTFVTRAIRIMEWIANMDVSGYQNHNGLNCIVKRLEWEVKKCQPYHGAILSPDEPSDTKDPSNVGAMETSTEQGQSPINNSPTEVPMETEQPALNGDCRMEVESDPMQPGPSSAEPASPGPVSKNRCLPQRAALIKAVLSFLKKSIPDPSFSDSIRNIMDSSLPTSLKYVISNVEYYGPVLFMAAIDVVTVYVFHEPSLLSSLQDGGLTGVLLKALVVKEIPATREVLSSLPSVLSALCLNTRGLQSFMKCQPFDKLFRVLLSPEYLPAMRRRRAADALGETANNLGTAMDELMRHQPTLKTEAMKAIIKLLEELCTMGQDPKYIGFKVTSKPEELSSEGGATSSRPPQVADEPMSDEDEDDEDRFSFTSTTSTSKIAAELGNKDSTKNAEEEKRTFVPLLDYILNVVKFVEAILSTNSTDDHCREFVRLKGLGPLVSVLGLPNLPLDFPSSPYCQAVSGVSKSILLLSHEPQVIKQAQLQLKDVLVKLKPLYQRSGDSAVSLLLHEVASSPRPSQAPESAQHTPLLHGIAAVHAYISMFLHTCKATQSDIRSLCISHWGSELGISVLQQLSELYISLVWETIVLESLRQPDASEEERQLSRDDLDLLKSFSGSQEDISDGRSDINPAAPPPAKDEVTSPKSSLKPGQVSLIKQLLHTASNLGRSLSEFFGLLVKLSISTAQRQRRAPHAAGNPSLPPLPARLVTEQLCDLLNSMLTWKGPPQVPLQRLRLHFYMCSVSFVSRLLYDDRKFPYHLMLQQFVLCKAHESFFGLFELVLSQNGTVPSDEGIEHSSLPDGTEEMLDAWLMLANRLVNCKSLLESSHSLPSQSNATGFVPFKPVEFLSASQKRAFHAVMLLWGRKLPKRYGAHIAELVLSIICHIIKGESTVQEKLKVGEKKEVAAGNAPALASTSRGSANPPPPMPEISEQQLQQLMDMGFSHEHAREALLSTSNIEQATDYILTHPPSAAARTARAIGVDMTEEDQMMRAIALSLGENLTASTGSQGPQEQGKLDPKLKQQPSSKSTKGDKSAEESLPLDRDILTKFTSEMLNCCLNLLTDVPETVCHVCELLAVASKRNGEEWRDRMLADLFRQISEDIQTVMKACSPDSNGSIALDECAAQMCSVTEAPRLASLLHLTCLLFEEMKVQCGKTVQSFDILDQVLQLLEICQNIMFQLKLASCDPTTPRWFSPLILLLDLYQKVALSSERKRAHDKCTTHTWKWFDDRSGRWYSYNVNNNTSIDNAYRNGEAKVRFMAGRRRYSVNFTTMVQVNEDSGNRRPIMLETVLESSKGSTTDGSGRAVQSKETAKLAAGSTEKGKTDTPSQRKSLHSEEPGIQKLNKMQKSLIIRCCTTFICIPVPPQALHAVLKLCLRITQEHEYAVQFVEQGGPAGLLRLTQKSVFPGFHSLAYLILRHALEDEDSLKHTMEKVVRSAAMNGVSSAASGVGPNSTGSKEINYMLRTLGPAAFRNPQLFTDVARNTLRYSITPQLRRTVIEGNQTSIPSNHAQIVEVTLPNKQVKTPPLCDSVKSVIHDLLCALCNANGLGARAAEGGVAEGVACVRRSDSQMMGEVGRALGQVGDMINSISGHPQQPGQTLSPRQHPSYTRQLTAEDAELEEMVLDSQSSSQGATTLSPSLAAARLEENDSKEPEIEKKENTESKTEAKPLLPKSAILKLLGELVKSYGGVAQLISEYNYQPQQPGGECEFEGPAVAFILDKLLPSSQTEDAESTSFARMLLAMIAACNQAPEAQQSLVTEVKASLARTLSLPESARKHSRLQAIFSLIQTMIESGLPQPNNTMKLLIKKGLITDLARVPHSLDLCSPNFVSTMNSMLKPLERLSGVVNQQNPVPPLAQGKDSTSQGTSEGNSAASGSTPTEARDSTTSGQPTNTVNVQQENTETEQSAMDTTDERATLGREMSGDQSAVSTVAPWQLGVSGRGIIQRTQEEEDLEELQDMVDEFLQSDIQEGGDGPGDRGNLVAERVISRHLINGRMVNETAYMLNADGGSDDSHSSSDSVDEDTGDEERSQHSEVGGDETMVITFDDQGDEDDVEDEEDEEDRDVDGDEDGDEDDDDADDNEGDEEPGEVRSVESAEGSQEERPTGAVVVMHTEAADNEDDEDDEEEDEDDEDDDDGGSDMEDPADIMEDSYRAYEDDIYPHDNGELFYESSPHSSRFFGTFVMSYSQDDEHGPSSSGMQRLSRVHGLRAERTTRHHVHQSNAVQLQQGHAGAEQPLPPPVIQSILGPEASSEVLQLNPGCSHRTRLLLGDDVQVISRVAEDGLGDDIFLDNFGDGPGSANASSSAIPSALTRWAEEGQILDPHSIHYCVATVKPDILPLLEKCQAEVLEKARAEEKKKKEEEAVTKAAAAKKEEEEKKKDKDKDTTQEEAGTSSDSQMEASSEGATTSSAEKMQVEQAAANSPPPASLLVSVHSNDGGATSAAFRSSTPTEGADSATAAAAAMTSVAESIIGTATSEAAIITAAAVANQAEATSTDAGTPASSQAAVGTTAAAESPMALVEEGSGDQSQESGPNEPSSPSEVSGSCPQATGQAQANTQSAGAAPEQGTLNDGEQPGSSGEGDPLTIDGIPIPDGVDPSFLEALPESIRREVLAEHLGLHPPPPPPSVSSSQVADGQATGSGDLNVSPEFLAALPLDVQQEVLQQQRLEQERRRVQTNPPDQPVDPGAFIRNLAPSLRQTVLADIDDSLLPLLPPEIATEAQSLRREIEARHHRLLQERFAFGSGDTASAISALLRHSGLSRRTGGSHFARLVSSGSGRLGGFSGIGSAALNGNRKLAGRQLLDHEALTCLLVLLFVDEPRLNTGRLHKVLRNLCYHEETRAWVVNTLISILRRTSGQSADGSCPVPTLRVDPLATVSSETSCLGSRLDEYLQHTKESGRNGDKKTRVQPWLSVTVDASLGCRTSVFCINRQGKVGLERSSHVAIHPHASLFVCRHVLDILLFLAKSFSTSFTPSFAKLHPPCGMDSSSSTIQPSKPGATAGLTGEMEFWDILVKLDAAGSGRKGKSAAKPSGNLQGVEVIETQMADFGASPMGQILTMLAHPVIQRDVGLTDKLLRLLSVVSGSLSTVPRTASKTPNASEATSESATNPPEANSRELPPAPSQDASPVMQPGSAGVEAEEPVANLPPVSCMPISETESVASSLIAERSSEAGGERHDVDSIDSGSADETLSHCGVTEPMVVEVSLPPEDLPRRADSDCLLLTTASASTASNLQKSPDQLPQGGPSIVMEEHLGLAVDVLTSGTCSEEGLEDATTLLLQIAHVNTKTHNSVLHLLLEGAHRTGELLCTDIVNLLLELIEHNRVTPLKEETKYVGKGKAPVLPIVMPSPPRRPARTAQGGRLMGTTAGRRAVKPIGSDLHLTSMLSLTCKTSNQALLLRVLKVIFQLREAYRNSAKRQGSGAATRRHQHGRVPDDTLVIQRLIQNSRGLGAVVAALETEAEALFQVFSQMRGGQYRNRERAGSQALTQGQNEGDGESANTAQGAATSSQQEGDSPPEPELPNLGEQLSLDNLWDSLGQCLTELAKTSDGHAVLVLQPAVEAFFLVHGTDGHETPASATEERRGAQRLASVSSEHFAVPASPGPLSPGLVSPSRQMSVTSVTSDLPSDTQKFLKFAETHRNVLNQILRQSTVHLADGPFAVLVDHTRVLDFDIKRRFFRQELERMDEGVRRDDLSIHVRREHVFEDSYRELHRRSSDDLKCRLYVVFEGEEGQDAGGVQREWYIIMSREMFNPNYALFTTSPGDRVTYQPNASSHCNSNHLSYFKFVGRIVAKAIYDNKLLECYFTRSFYKHILGKPVHFTDLEAFDYSFYQGLLYLLEHDISEIGMDLTFSTEIQEFGLSEHRDLIQNGRNISVTEENKKEYVKLVCQMKMTGAIRKQIDGFLEGFYEIIPKRLISIFNEQELELLISGLPNIDLDDLKANSEYHKYSENSLQIQWFWRALRSFDQADRAKFLQFVTGTSKVPLQGFAALEGMNGFQKFQIHRDDRSTDRLPSAHTCFNQLDLPAYETYDKLRTQLQKACDECPEGFGLA